MIPAWSLGVILLGYVFGFPVPFNSTQRMILPMENMSPFLDYDHTIPPEETHVPWNNTDTEYGSTPEELMQSRNETDSNSTLPVHRYNGPPLLMDIRERKRPLHEYYAAAPQGCVVSLCALGHIQIQGGDESAGGATRDPHGNGDMNKALDLMYALNAIGKESLFRKNGIFPRSATSDTEA